MHAGFTRQKKPGKKCSTIYRPLDTGVPGSRASGRPPFRKNTIIGHQFVNADWNKFTPTNSVNQRKLAFT
jgi:hypothetical protein